MGGLLAAEAATHLSNNLPGHHRPHRIVGMLAFDTPYLGMHPHVVITGIASLFDGDDDKKKTETEMNNDTVQIVDSQVTDNWDNFKKNAPGQYNLVYLCPLPVEAFSSGRSSTASIQSSSSPGYLSPAPASPSASSSRLSLAPSSPSFMDRSNALMSKAQGFIDSHSEDPLVRWMRKHSNEPVTAAKRWMVEHFQFGSCMFDPSGLKDRYTALVNWNGLWVNYWTQTAPPDGSGGKIEEADNNAALVENGMAESIATKNSSESSSKEKEKRLKKLKKEQEKEAKKGKVPRHFVVLPTGLGKVLGGGEKWEKVLIAGVEDEVAAHCGLFIRGQNTEYDGFVERVGQKVIGWLRTL